MENELIPYRVILEDRIINTHTNLMRENIKIQISEDIDHDL